MCSLDKLNSIIEEYAPIEISRKAIERGDYDNSGIIVKNTETVSKILFSLDLSNASVEYAKLKGCDTIVTHHPAIYAPIKNLSCDGQTGALLSAIKGGMNIISAHLNLDMTTFGIDFYLAEGVGALEQKILDGLYEEYGYGREFNVAETSLEKFVGQVKNNFTTDKIIAYGNKNVKKVASFCGGGSSTAMDMVVKGLTDADTIISSDMPHHVLKELIENGKNVVIIPHYVSEQYGFNKFYQYVSQKLTDDIETFYFIDDRFM